MIGANTESNNMLDSYIHDYLVKQKFHASAKAFLAEGKISADSIPIQAPGGFLSEWWTVFWDIHNSRKNDNNSGVDISTVLANLNPAPQSLQHQLLQLEHQQLQQQHQRLQQQHQQLRQQYQYRYYQLEKQYQQMQRILCQQQQYQLQRNNTLMRQNLPTGLGQLHSGLVQPNSMMQSPPSFSSDPLQQQRTLEAQQDLLYLSTSDWETLSSQLNIHTDEANRCDDMLNGSSHCINKWLLLAHSLQQTLLSNPNIKSPMQLDVLHRGDSNVPFKLEEQQLQDCMSSTYGGYEQAVEHQIGRKRKQGIPSPSPTHSSNTIGPCSSSPSVQTPGDRVGQPGEVRKGFVFNEIRVLPTSSTKVECCHFSSDGKLLATGGDDNKVVLWCMESFLVKSTLEEHADRITDVRFRENTSRLATTSADKTAKVWDAHNPGSSIRTFTRHRSTVMSVDFHPKNEDLVLSSDNSEVWIWSIKNGCGSVTIKAGAMQLRFQPCLRNFLAVTSENTVSIFEGEAGFRKHKLQGHENAVESICWSVSGEYLASVSSDRVRVWRFEGSELREECIQEMRCSEDRKFRGCVFHAEYLVLMVIGEGENGMKVWDVEARKTTTVLGHEGVILSLAVSEANGMIASTATGHNNCVKLWKCTTTL